MASLLRREVHSTTTGGIPRSRRNACELHSEKETALAMAVPPLASAITGRLTWSVRVLLKRILDQADPILTLCPRAGKEPMQYNPANPLIVQGDRTILLEVDNPLHAEARDTIAPFAELEKSPEHIHTYRLTPLSLWNAAAAGMTAEEMIAGLETYSKFPIPPTYRLICETW